MVVLREWRGRADARRAELYAEHFRNYVVPKLTQSRGFLGASLIRRERDPVVEFVVLSRWTSLDAVRKFAGDQSEKAVVEPAAAAALISYDHTVSHYDLIEEVTP